MGALQCHERQAQDLVTDTDWHSMLMAEKWFNKPLVSTTLSPPSFHLHSLTAGIMANINKP